MPKIPTVTSNIPRDLRTFVDRVREAMDGTGPDSLVSARQLVAAGVASYTGNILGPVNTETYGTPQRPENVEATGALANIMVTWDKPVYNGHAYAEIWAAQQTEAQETAEEAPTLGQAELIGMSPGVFFAHNIGEGGKRWYWVRFVNYAGEAGPYQSTDGIAGETSLSPTYMLQVLSDAITQSQLASELSTKVDRIDTKARIFRQETAPTGTEELPLSIGDLWVDTNRTYFDDYTSGDYEILANRMYRWNGSAWEEFMDYGAADFFTSINTERTQRVQEDSALAQSIQVVEAGVQGVDAKITTEATTRASEDSALATQISTLSSTVVNNKTVTDAYIAQVANTAASDTGAVATDLETIRATYLDNTNGSVWAAITSESEARASADGAISGRVDTIEANYVTAAQAVAAAIQSSDIAKANELEAVANRTTTLETNIGPDIAAAVQTEAEARADADGTINSKYAVKVDAGGHVAGYGLIASGNEGNITSEFGIRADAFWLAPPVNTDANAPTQNVYPGFVWKQNGTGTTQYYTGSGWSTEPQNLPFVVRTSPTTINGETVPPGVYMQDAYIANGTITNAKIGDAAIDNAKIANLDAGKITTGSLDANRIVTGSLDAKIANLDAAVITSGFINSARIEDASIALAKIDVANITTLESISANMGTITAGKMQSTDGNFVIDLDNKTISIET